VVRGLITGLITGAFVMALLLAIVSLSLPMPEQATDTAIRESAQQPTFGDMQQVHETQQAAGQSLELSQMEAPIVDDSPVVVDSTSAIRPESGGVDENVAVTESESSLPEVSLMNDEGMDSSAVVEMDVPAVDQGFAVSGEVTQPENQATDAGEIAIKEGQQDELPPIALAGEATSEADVQEETKAQSSTFASDSGFQTDDRIVTNRLPTISALTAGGSSPLVANAEAFTNPDNRPLLSIVLIDTGEFNINADALASFPYPITFAIDPLREDALEKVQSYRARGFEVLAVADLPTDGDGSLPSLALMPTLDSVPGLVGVLEGTDSGLQGNMELAEEVLRAVSGSGYGLILRPKGLNAAQQIADGRNLAVETLFRDFDANGQDATVIRRFLDQAAFKARQEGEIVMVGRLRPATISALLLWGLQDRASSVALAPISAVLQQ
jgi:polysaccharide deacetylase 2 family uncharacterized protein YibQ